MPPKFEDPNILAGKSKSTPKSKPIVDFGNGISIVGFGGSPFLPKYKKLTNNPKPFAKKKTKKVKNMSDELEANNVVMGRTHNPFTGLKEETIFPPDHPSIDKVKEELAKLTEPSEVEITPVKVTVRPLRRTAQAALRIALDRLDTGAISKRQVINTLPVKLLKTLLTSVVADVTGLSKLGNGLAAAVGVANANRIAYASADAIKLAGEGFKVLLKVNHTSPEDMEALKVVVGIVTDTGGFTSHSAVVARQLGKPCIVAFKAGSDPLNAVLATNPAEMNVSIDGTNGILYAGEAKLTSTTMSDDTKRFMQLCGEVATLKVFANADSDDDVSKSVDVGAAGIGLCRTEHTVFSSKDSLLHMRRMILATEKGELENALYRLKVAQSNHFVEFFRKARKIPVVIRLLDPPMHEFLPGVDDKVEIAEIAKSLKITQSTLKSRIKDLHEINPMLGKRGVRLAVAVPKLYHFQTSAILESAWAAIRQEDYYGSSKINVGIMIPLIATYEEAKVAVDEIRATIKSYEGNYPEMFQRVKVTLGAMLETPRACLIANQLASLFDFFSFGTNDLTQTTWAISRDDSNSFMSVYKDRNIVAADPFESLDVGGVGMLMDHAITSLGALRAKMKIGICGEHGGDPESIAFCHKLKLDYVSCSPTRVQLAVLAAAKAEVADDPVEVLNIVETVIDNPVVQVAKPSAYKMPEEKKKPIQKSTIGKANFPEINKMAGVWTSGLIPTEELNWSSWTEDSQKSIVNGKQTYYYVNIHAKELPSSHEWFNSLKSYKHCIVVLDKTNFVYGAGSVKVNIPGQSVEIPETVICTVSPVPEETLSTVLKDLGIANWKKVSASLEVKESSDISPAMTKEVAEEQVVPFELWSDSQISTLKKLPLKEGAISLANHYVTRNSWGKHNNKPIWAKVIGYALNPFNTKSLAVLLPHDGPTAMGWTGPLKKFATFFESKEYSKDKVMFMLVESIDSVKNKLE